MIINLKNPLIKFLVFIVILVFLFVFQKSNFSTVEETTTIFLSSILPSLFPFILFTNMLLNLNGLSFLKQILKDKYYVVFCIITGFLCGYPMGARTVASFLKDKKISYTQAKILLSFVNNCNPIFILSTLGISILKNMNHAIILLISHYLSAIIICLFYFSHNIIHKTNKNSNIFKINETKILHNSIFDSLNISIKSTFLTLGNIFAYTTLFSLLYSCLKELLKHSHISPIFIKLLSPLFETTGGIKEIVLNSSYNINLTLCIISFALGFSGLSIIFQIYACIYKEGFSIMYIIKNKILHGIISSSITYLILKILNIKSKMIIDYDYLLENFKIIKITQYSYFVLCVCMLYFLVYSFNTTNKVLKKVSNN